MTDDMDDDARSDDEKAVAALFAALVEDSPGSQLSPSEVVRLGRIELRESLDVRVRRLKIVRNLLVAAALVAAVVLVAPHLGGASSTASVAVSAGETRSPGSGSVAVARVAAAGESAPASGSSAAATSAAAASSAPMVSGSVAGSGSDAAASPPGAGGPQKSPGSATGDDAQPASSGAPSSVASSVASSAASSGRPAAVPPPAKTSQPANVPPASVLTTPSPLSTVPDSSGTGECRPLSAAAIKAARSAFPAGYFGVAVAPTGCTSTGIVLPAASAASSTDAQVAVNVRKAKPGACVLPDEGAPCSKTATPDVYALTSFATETDIWVYGRGYEVYLRVGQDFPQQVTTNQLIAAGRAVIKALA